MPRKSQGKLREFNFSKIWLPVQGALEAHKNLPELRSIQCAEHRNQICYSKASRRFMNCPFTVSKLDKCSSVGPKP